MGFCINHKDRNTSLMCSKYNEFMCEECAKCKDPDIYCKFRPNCTISYIDKEKRREERK